MAGDPLKAEELKERKIFQTKKIEEFSFEGEKFESINDFTSFTTDGEHIYAYHSEFGIVKFSIKENNFGKILLLDTKFRYTAVSIVFIDGKLFVRDQL